MQPPAIVPPDRPDPGPNSTEQVIFAGEPSPRASKASALVLVPAAGGRLEPPPLELGKIQAAIFRQTVAAVAANHFSAEDMVLLLCGYARAAALERRAVEELLQANQARHGLPRMQRLRKPRAVVGEAEDRTALASR